VVGQVEGAVEVENKEQQGRKQDKRSAEYPAGDSCNDTAEGEPESDAPSLRDPSVDTEEAECCGIEKVSARGNELEKVAVRNLAVNDTSSTGEKQNLVTYTYKGSSGKQKGSQVEEYQGAGE